MRNRDSRRRNLAVILLIPLLVSACRSGCRLDPSIASEDLVVMSWNVENLFDDVDNGSEYWEFDPENGVWTRNLYLTRVSEIARYILEEAPFSPDIICLQEIENSSVLTELLEHSLGREGYRYRAVTEDPDSAVQLGVLSRFPIIDIRIHGVETPLPYKIRPILEVRVSCDDETVVILNNHWKSRSDGVAVTEPVRIASASAVREIAENLIAEHPDHLLLIAGDLNENADEEGLSDGAFETALYRSEREGSEGIRITGTPEEVSFSLFYDPWIAEEEYLTGSYRFRGTWNTLDHIICGRAAFDRRGLEFNFFVVDNSPELLDAEGSPLSWSKLTGKGYSDHLPVFAVFRRAAE